MNRKELLKTAKELAEKLGAEEALQLAKRIFHDGEKENGFADEEP